MAVFFCRITQVKMRGAKLAVVLSSGATSSALSEVRKGVLGNERLRSTAVKGYHVPWTRGATRV